MASLPTGSSFPPVDRRRWLDEYVVQLPVDRFVAMDPPPVGLMLLRIAGRPVKRHALPGL